MLLDLISLVEKYNIKINGVIHIGAHFGEENNLYEKLQIKERIFFEPLVKNFQVLQNNVIGFPIHKLALGNENRKIKMFLESANKGQSCSILKPKKHKEQYPHIIFEGEEEVDMIRLDDFSGDTKNFNFINIDVQGYELEVFKGAVTLLKNIKYIITEVNRDELYENCAKDDELDLFLGQFGFVRVETTWDGGTWGDSLYIKNEPEM